jgi:uncharacterized membrane protein YidH (DUF202 family)
MSAGRQGTLLKNIGNLQKGLDDAAKYKWTIADMKKDWKLIYPFEKNKMKIKQIEKEEAKRKKEMAKLEKDAAKREADAFKKEATLEKSRVALERLQLNWVKWNITCIALGFTAYKFWYARVHDEKNVIGYYITGREVGLFLIVLGFVSLLIATRQHKKSVTNLKLQYENMHRSVSLRLSYVILVFSVIVFLMVLLRA